MSIHTFTRIQKVPVPIEELWDFISSPHNLKHITPEHMGFNILTKNLPQKMYPGMIISYKVSPVLGIKMTWVTEITHVEHLRYFVDEQRVGPYAMWHHEHHLKEIEGGVEMTDIVSYQPPMGFLGTIANTLFIEQQLNDIFNFRTAKMNELFGTL